MAAPNLAAVLPSAATNLTIQQRPIPNPSPDEILIRNHAIGLNPIDWKRQLIGLYIASYPTVLGSDVCGVVVKTGSSVPISDFKPGDRVIGSANSFSGDPDHAAFQTYTLVKAASAARLPGALSFNQGATVPTAFATATVALFDILNLPLPSSSSASPPSAVKTGILVWGGATQAGSALIQLLRLTMPNLTVFATASLGHHDRLRGLGADYVADYRSATVVDDILTATDKTGVRIEYAVDTVSTPETLSSVVKVLGRFEGGKRMLGHLLPWPEDDKVVVPEGVEYTMVRGNDMWTRRRDLSEWLFRERLTGWLEREEIVPGKYRVVEGGLEGLQAGLDELKRGAVNGERLVVEV